MKKNYSIIDHKQQGIDPATGKMTYLVRYEVWEGCRCGKVEKEATVHTNGVPSLKLVAQADRAAV